MGWGHPEEEEESLEGSRSLAEGITHREAGCQLEIAC